MNPNISDVEQESITLVLALQINAGMFDVPDHPFNSITWLDSIFTKALVLLAKTSYIYGASDLARVHNQIDRMGPGPRSYYIAELVIDRILEIS